MGEVTVAPVVESRDILQDSDTVHWVCCCTNDNVSACGMDMTNVPWSGPDDPPCVVCEDLWPDGFPCPLCGCWECA